MLEEVAGIVIQVELAVVGELVVEVLEELLAEVQQVEV